MNALELFSIFRSLLKKIHRKLNFFPSLDNISSSTPTTTMANNNSMPNRKKPSKKTSKNSHQQQHFPLNVNLNSYEHHLERWLENTSKMNFDYNNLDGNNWSIMNASNGATNRKGNNNHLQYSSADPISLPTHMVRKV